MFIKFLCRFQATVPFDTFYGRGGGCQLIFLVVQYYFTLDARYGMIGSVRALNRDLKQVSSADRLWEANLSEGCRDSMLSDFLS